MSDHAYRVPANEKPAPPPVFTTVGLEDSRGWLKWVPELVLGLGVDVSDAGRPHFNAAVSSRLRRLQAHFHPDRPTGNVDHCR